MGCAERPVQSSPAALDVQMGEGKEDHPWDLISHTVTEPLSAEASKPWGLFFLNEAMSLSLCFLMREIRQCAVHRSASFPKVKERNVCLKGTGLGEWSGRL